MALWTQLKLIKSWDLILANSDLLLVIVELRSTEAQTLWSVYCVCQDDRGRPGVDTVHRLTTVISADGHEIVHSHGGPPDSDTGQQYKVSS